MPQMRPRHKAPDWRVWGQSPQETDEILENKTISRVEKCVHRQDKMLRDPTCCQIELTFMHYRPVT